MDIKNADRDPFDQILKIFVDDLQILREKEFTNEYVEFASIIIGKIRRSKLKQNAENVEKGDLAKK